MDWQAVSSIATAAAAIFALFTAIIMAWQARLMRQSISVDALLRLDAHFNSPDMRKIRRKAAAYLMRQKFNSHLVLPDEEAKCRIALDDLLDFFEGIAFLVRKRKTPDLESVWCFFFHFIDHYYRAAEKYIKQSRKSEKDELRWQELENFHKDLIAIERRFRKYEPPNCEQLRRFLGEEAYSE